MSGRSPIGRQTKEPAKEQQNASIFTSCVVLTTFISAAPALAVTDPSGDFLPTHIGPGLASVDIRDASVISLSGSFIFHATMDGTLRDPGTSYVWGIDRGAGTAGLFAGSPAVGAGVTFDAVVVVRPDGSGTVTAFNQAGPPTITDILGSTFIVDTDIITFVNFDLLPSRGAAIADYGFNFWTRTGGGNTGIADLAQGEGTFGAVPEPATWGLLIIGFGLVGCAARRRQAVGASA